MKTISIFFYLIFLCSLNTLAESNNTLSIIESNCYKAFNKGFGDYLCFKRLDDGKFLTFKISDTYEDNRFELRWCSEFISGGLIERKGYYLEFEPFNTNGTRSLVLASNKQGNALFLTKETLDGRSSDSFEASENPNLLAYFYGLLSNRIEDNCSIY